MYFSPTTLRNKENFMFWGEIYWPRQYTGGKMIQQFWYNGNKIYSDVISESCQSNWHNHMVCKFIKGDYFRIAKRETSLQLKGGEKIFPLELFPGRYRMRVTMVDTSIFACIEIDFNVVK